MLAHVGKYVKEVRRTHFLMFLKDNMEAEQEVTEEDEEEELQRLDGDGEEEDEADDIVVGDPKESGQERQNVLFS